MSDQKVYVFDVLDPPNLERLKQPALTITISGLMRLNTAAREAIGNPEHVELLYNVRDRTVGIRSTHSQNSAARVVFRGGNSLRTAVSGAGLMRRIGIALPKESHKIIGKAVDGVLIFDVSNMEGALA